MEELLLFFIGVCLFAIVYGIYKLVVIHRRNKEREQTRVEELRAKIEADRKAYNEKRRQQATMNTPPLPKVAEVQKQVDATRKKYTPTSTPSPTQSVQMYNTSSDSRNMDDGFVSGMLTHMLIDTAIDSFKHGTDGDTGKTYDREVERSVGITTSTREVGYDSSDEPSRSSSWSSSSSSSDSWSSSSSDSGPSSDW